MLNTEDKQSLINRQFEKAYSFLDQADEMMQLEHWDLASNRFYYACFHAVQGLFVAHGISSHTHSGTVSQFSLHYVKTGLIEVTYGSFLARLQQLRQKADYNCWYDVTQQEVSTMRQPAHELIDRIAKLADYPQPDSTQ